MSILEQLSRDLISLDTSLGAIFYAPLFLALATIARLIG